MNHECTENCTCSPESITNIRQVYFKSLAAARKSGRDDGIRMAVEFLRDVLGYGLTADKLKEYYEENKTN